MVAVIIFAAAFAAAFYLSLPKADDSPNFKFKAVEQGVAFYSNELPPGDFLKAFSDSNEFTIVVSASSEAQSYNSFAGNALVLLTSVLQASGKKPVSLVKQFDNNSLAYCQTNKGLAVLNETISVSECMEMLGSEAKFIIIESPDSSLKQPEVLLEKNKVTVKTQKASDFQAVPLIVLKTMFSDSEEKIKIINDFAKKVSG
ncbi:MAG TPA: hypothetical protein HA227_03585 [Candidatus Diapherotrites archaeon]|uniref:Uncharacterized protein n=1 Tax=Candidatus Iainarchaeum sp. TaxID=3101447 RepID=A0A7J4KTH0_9ARCH|nr:hypothetical protein [Candidatus Diapherotrites archaeon]